MGNAAKKRKKNYQYNKARKKQRARKTRMYARGLDLIEPHVCAFLDELLIPYQIERSRRSLSVRPYLDAPTRLGGRRLWTDCLIVVHLMLAFKRFFRRASLYLETRWEFRDINRVNTPHYNWTFTLEHRHDYLTRAPRENERAQIETEIYKQWRSRWGSRISIK